MTIRAFRPPRQAVSVPNRHDDWTLLMRKAIERAETMQDRRLPGLRKALVDGKTEAHLRMLGIICEGDLFREFPDMAR